MDYEEGMQYGMIGYYVPHRVYPAGYHCDPKQPLPFAGLASQKNHMSLYLMCIYGDTPISRLVPRCLGQDRQKARHGQGLHSLQKRMTTSHWTASAESIRRVPAKKYIEYCEAARQVARASKSGPSRKASRTEKR